MKPSYWQSALNHLKQKDQILGGLIEQFPDLALQSRGNAFETLCRSIVGQQISVKAADSVWLKIEQNIVPLSPISFIEKELVQLKKLGLSTQKSNYLQNISHYFIDNNIDDNYWKNKPYSEIKKGLISIKGIGNWTVEMFAIFYLLEADIFPTKDLGILRAMQNLYGKDVIKSVDDMEAIAKKWQPYKTVATWYLWRSIDADVVVY